VVRPRLGMRTTQLRPSWWISYSYTSVISAAIPFQALGQGRPGCCDRPRRSRSCASARSTDCRPTSTLRDHRPDGP
jgi:hypothetical protein